MMHRVSTAFLILGLASLAACDKVTCMRPASPLCGDARQSAAEAHNSRGLAHAAKREHDLAIASFDSAIQLRPALATAFRNRGISYVAKDQIDRAIQDFDEAIRLNSDYAGAYNSRGFAKQLKGDHESALRDYDRAIALAPDNAIAHRNRANVEFILGRFGDAARDLERSLKFVAAATQPDARFNETGGYAVVWLHVAKMRQGLNDSAEFRANAARIDSSYWPRPVVSFFEGKMTGEQLVAQTASVADPKLRDDQRCGAEFFAGQAAIWKNELAAAKKHLTTMSTTCSKRFVENAAAVADLRRLETAFK